MQRALPYAALRAHFCRGQGFIPNLSPSDREAATPPKRKRKEADVLTASFKEFSILKSYAGRQRGKGTDGRPQTEFFIKHVSSEKL